MLKSVTALLRDISLKAGKKDRRIRIAIFLAIVLPVILIAAFAYYGTYQELTEFTFSRRQSLADLAATVLEQKLERLTDIGVSLVPAYASDTWLVKENGTKQLKSCRGFQKIFR